MKNYAVAIDGPSGAGKSTLARAVAQELQFVYVDTGAIYRTVGYRVWQTGTVLKEEAVAEILPGLEIALAYDGQGLQRMQVNGEDVTEKIRLPEVSMYASHVAAMPAVRSFLLEMQRDMARRSSVVMDGRDIGTVVLPDADVKVFLTASAEERAKRRFRELKQRGHHMYIITNAVASVQRSRLRGSVFAELFEAAFISEEAGAAKPSKAYFDYVRRQLPGLTD